jgi:hypothetical protein
MTVPAKDSRAAAFSLCAASMNYSGIWRFTERCWTVNIMFVCDAVEFGLSFESSHRHDQNDVTARGFRPAIPNSEQEGVYRNFRRKARLRCG